MTRKKFINYAAKLTDIFIDNKIRTYSSNKIETFGRIRMLRPINAKYQMMFQFHLCCILILINISILNLHYRNHIKNRKC